MAQILAEPRAEALAGPGRRWNDVEGMGPGSSGRSTSWLASMRPWFSLYGRRLSNQDDDEQLAAILRILPDEVMLECLKMVDDIVSVVFACCSNRRWAALLRKHDILYRRACLDSTTYLGLEHNMYLYQKIYGSSWSRFWKAHPRLRIDGIYASRNTYVRQGIQDLVSKKGALLMAYYRYYRFYSDGTFLYKTSPLTPSEIIHQLQRNSPKRGTGLFCNAEKVHKGVFSLDGENLCVSIKYFYAHGGETTITTRLRLRTTSPGANNRLDVVSMESVNSADETPISHRNGLNTFVFINLNEVANTILNLPPSKLDFYIPG